ncbi:MAG: leucine-rich repeat protein, partial [Tissierellia bacterium]|nr:leucine-rich repeat protein [Tissierellia bacterium]
MDKGNKKHRLIHSLLAFAMVINIIVPGIMGPKSLAEEGTPQNEFILEDTNASPDQGQEKVKTYRTTEEDFLFDEEEQKILGLREDLTRDQKIHLVLPDKIKGIEVRTIDSLAFYGDERIHYIDLRDHKYLEEIGDYAFAFVKPEQILLENLPSLEKIQDYAFYDNQSKMITMEKLDELKEIGDYAFSNYLDENFEDHYGDFIHDQQKTTDKEILWKFSKLALQELPYEEGKVKDEFDEKFNQFIQEKEKLQQEKDQKKETLEKSTEVDPPAVVDQGPIHKNKVSRLAMGDYLVPDRRNQPMALGTMPMNALRGVGDTWDVTPTTVTGDKMDIDSVSVEETGDSLVWTVVVKQKVEGILGATLNYYHHVRMDKTVNDPGVRSIELQNQELNPLNNVSTSYYTSSKNGLNKGVYTYTIVTDIPSGEESILPFKVFLANSGNTSSSNGSVEGTFTAKRPAPPIVNKNFNFIVKDNSSPAS